MNTQTITQLKKLFREKETDTPIKKLKGYMSYDDVTMFFPKTKNTKEVLKSIFNTEMGKTPNIDYSYYQFTKIGIDMLENLIKLLQTTKDEDEGVIIGVGEDSPLVIETDSFAFMIASRDIHNKKAKEQCELFKQSKYGFMNDI